MISSEIQHVQVDEIPKGTLGLYTTLGFFVAWLIIFVITIKIEWFSNKPRPLASQQETDLHDSLVQ